MSNAIEQQAKPAPTMRWDGASWTWIDDERRRCEEPPNISEITKAAIERSSAAEVSRRLGLSRQTVCALAAGTATLGSTYIVAGLRLGNLVRIAEEL